MRTYALTVEALIGNPMLPVNILDKQFPAPNMLEAMKNAERIIGSVGNPDSVYSIDLTEVDR